MTTRLIDLYKAVEDNSRRMLQAAHAGDWRVMADIEDSCKQMIHQLKQAALQAEGNTGSVAPLTAEEQAEKQRILCQILGLDAQIRCLAEPWPLADRPRLLH